MAVGRFLDCIPFLRLTTCMWSENTQSIRGSYFWPYISVKAVTSNLCSKVLWSDNNSTGHPSISWNVSNIATLASLRFFSSLMVWFTWLIASNPFAIHSESGFVFGVWRPKLVRIKAVDGSRCTGRIIRSANVCFPHSGLPVQYKLVTFTFLPCEPWASYETKSLHWAIFKKAINLGFSDSQRIISVFTLSKKLMKGS